VLDGGDRPGCARHATIAEGHRLDSWLAIKEQAFPQRIALRTKGWCAGWGRLHRSVDQRLPGSRAVALKDKGVPVPEIAKKLVIRTGTNAGKNPSVASLYRAFAEAEEAAADDGLPLRPKPVRIRRPGGLFTAEKIDLRERLQAQPHPNTEIRS